MEATALSLGKSAVDAALGYAKSVLAEEAALRLGVQRDHAFIRDELEMMRAFLMAAHEERDEHTVVRTWVKQGRDVAYDAEDALQEVAVRLLGSRSWWRLPRTRRDRRRVAARMKELRARVEDVSQRNVRYQLIRGSVSKAAASASNAEQPSRSVISGTEEAMRQRSKAKMDLIRLIHNKKEAELQVIAIWGANRVPWETSIVKRAYDDLKKDNKFQCQAWMSITHPFDQVQFIQNIIRQFLVDSLQEAAKTTGEKSDPGAQEQDLWKIAGTLKEGADSIGAFQNYVKDKSLLIVLDNLCSKEEGDQIIACFPDNKTGSRLLFCTEKIEVASLCAGNETERPEHRQLSTDPTLFAFYKKDSRDGPYSIQPEPRESLEITDKNCSAGEKRPTRIGTGVLAFKESQLIGRMDEKSKVVKLVLDNSSQDFEVISVYGMGGLGKTTLVKHVYQSQELCNMFEKHACVTVKHPFDPRELLDSLATQLSGGVGENPGHQQSVTSILEEKKYLLVVDDLSSTAEWDAINHYFPRTQVGSRIIITTRVENIAKHCSKKEQNIHKLKILGEKDSCNLFTEKVFGKITNLGEEFPELAEVAKLILKKCNGLPLAIVTIGGFLSKQAKTPVEWMKLNEHIGVELEMNQELGTIKDILIKSYHGLPYYLKSCFLYMSIFPEDHNISRRRLVRRWIAEGYSHGVRFKSLKDIADSYFMELIDRNVLIPLQVSIGCRNGIDYCQIHDIMREISISKSLEEDLVYIVEEGCRSNTMVSTRHLSISSNWAGDQSEFESIVDLSRVRSLTVFGRWRSFFISGKMRLLRVLDLEGTSNLFDHHLIDIGMLIHLKYLSVRGCDTVYHLPDSLGNLKQLQTLDIKDTGIFKLPKCIIKLRKLQYIRARPNHILHCESYENLAEHSELPKILRNRLCICTVCSLFSYVACCNHVIREGILGADGDSNRRDVCTWYCHTWLPFLARLPDLGGVLLPRGFRKMKDLHTLGVVNIASGKSILQDIGCLAQLCKLAVIGVNRKNFQEFCSVIAGLSCLESLSVKFALELGWMSCPVGCLDAVSPPPKSLQSLKLNGKLVKLPEWIMVLQNLVKLKLHKTWLSEVDATMQLLGKLPSLAILRLLRGSFNGEGHRLIFFREAPFPSLAVLELENVYGPFCADYKFEEGAMPTLELLFFHGNGYNNKMSGLESLPKLKEFKLHGSSDDAFREKVQAQLAKNPNLPMLKRY